MFLQGDRERALGQPISPLMDRTKGGVTKSQTGFFNIVAMPIFTSFVQVFPEASDMLHNLRSNYEMWNDAEVAAASAAAAVAAAVAALSVGK